MRKQISIWILLCAMAGNVSAKKETIPPYKNSELSISDRVEDLLSQMTLKEKFWQMFMIPGDLSNKDEDYTHGIFGFQVAAKGQSGDAAQQLLSYGPSGSAADIAKKINAIQKYFKEESRLGIPIIPFDEALHGLVRDGATAFPQSIGLSATFDTTLIHQVGHSIAQETRSRGIRQILSPVVNIARDVRWGRVEESYGEDPYLSGEMGYSFTSEFEKIGVITTPKHFVANVGAGGRDSYPIHYNERQLEEIYFPAFKRCFQDAGARSVMTSYNSLDGTPCTANEWLLRKKLKGEWNFHGFTISDAGATGGGNVLHFTSKDYAQSTAQAVEGGLDVIFQTSYSHYPLFWEAFEKGMISKKAIDDAVRRILTIKFELGLFENPYSDPKEAMKQNASEEHMQIAQQAAEESFVLLKNNKQTLPLSKSIKSIALIGNDIEKAPLGGYSGPGSKNVSILTGIKEKLGDHTEIYFAKGCGKSYSPVQTISSEYFVHSENGEQKKGLKAEYWDNITLEGTPKLTRNDANIDFRWTLFSPDQEKIPYDWYSARWTGTLIAPQSETVELGFTGNDGYRLWIDGKLVLDDWRKETHSTHTTSYTFEKGKHYNIKIEYYENAGNAWFKMVWNHGVSDQEKEIEEAVSIAQKSDVAVVSVGITEGEFQDRALLSLPGKQEEMIRRIAATGTPTVVLLVGGSAITMDRWIDRVNSVMDIWYPGDMGGYAVANTLFGDATPGGKLPITFPKSAAQCPLYYNHKPTGRGDDYNNMSGKPAFPFGFGLSYTNFSYSNLKVSNKTVRENDEIKIQCTITNTGTYTGDEVVQLYIHDELASVSRPVKELKGFKRITLSPNESKEVTFTLNKNDLMFLDKNLHKTFEPGKVRIMIGTSSQDILLRDFINLIK